MTLLKTFHLRLKAKHNTVVPKRVSASAVPFFFALIRPSVRLYALALLLPLASPLALVSLPPAASCWLSVTVSKLRPPPAAVWLPFACVSSAFSVLPSFYVYTILYSYKLGRTAVSWYTSVPQYLGCRPKQHPLNLGGIPSHFTPCPIYPTPFLKNFLRLHATVPWGKRLLNFQNEVRGDTFFLPDSQHRQSPCPPTLPDFSPLIPLAALRSGFR